MSVGGLTGAQKAQALAQKESEFRELILRAYKATGFGGTEARRRRTASSMARAMAGWW